MCGAVSGAVMALGLAFGRKNEGEEVDRSYSPGIREFCTCPAKGIHNTRS